MRAVGLVVLMVLAGCSSEPAAGAKASPSAPPTAVATATSSPVATCRLPVYWDVNRPSPPGIDLHAGFVSVPDGAVSEVGVLPELANAFGATYDAASDRWLRIFRQLLSPDGTEYTYWAADPTHDEVHVVDIATGADRTIYNGPTLYIPIAFEQDVIYLVHAINPRQSVFEKLYRVDPAGGAPPTLVPGSDHHMYQYGWVLISDGAAWGIDYRVQGGAYVYSVLRLDLATAEVTLWMEGPPDDQILPSGTDQLHRLYISDGQQLWRLVSPGQRDTFANPGQVSGGASVGGSTAFVSDSKGVWFAGRAGVWFYSDAGEPKQFSVGPPDADVYPAGPCV